MASSTVEICNNALIKIGANTITALSDDTKAARLCNKMYGIVRNDLLRSHIWNFALGRSQLAQLSNNPPFGYSYQYQLPSDCLRVIKLHDSNAEYRIEGRKLLTDANTVKLIYIKEITDTAQFDSTFDNVLALKLASELAYAMTQNGGLAGALKKEYELHLRRAKMIDAQEDSMYIIETDTLLHSRDFGPGSGGNFGWDFES